MSRQVIATVDDLCAAGAAVLAASAAALPLTAQGEGVMTERGADEMREQIRQVAFRLFAQLGYDNTDLRLIGDSVGISPEAVEELTGGKRELYLSVLAEGVEGLLAHMDIDSPDYTPDAAGFCLLADRYLAYLVEHPELRRIWMQRWLSDAADLSDLENTYTAPTIGPLIDRWRPGFRPGVDVHMAIFMTFSAINDFVAGGVVLEDGKWVGAESRAACRRLSDYVHEHIATYFVS